MGGSSPQNIFSVAYLVYSALGICDLHFGNYSVRSSIMDGMVHMVQGSPKKSGHTLSKAQDLYFDQQFNNL